MSTFPLIDVKLWLDQFDVSGDHNQLSLGGSATMVPSTTFGSSGWETVAGGLRRSEITAAGFVNLGSGAIEDILAADLGVSRICSYSPDGGQAGEVAFLHRSLLATLELGGTVGDMAAFSINATGSGPFAHGLVLENATKTATYNGTAYELGAVAATESLYGAIHVITVSGTDPTLDVIVESDADGGMASPTTRLTFTQATAATAEWQSAAGAITDTHYRVGVTIGGTNPSFLFVVTVGIA